MLTLAQHIRADNNTTTNHRLKTLFFIVSPSRTSAVIATLAVSESGKPVSMTSQVMEKNDLRGHGDKKEVVVGAFRY
jgi:hypothetical protein